MRLSGNGNAKQFLKKHGVTELQMQSEKKYSTRAADEYKRHLRKLLSEAESEGGGAAPSPGPAEQRASAAWESSSGLDNLLRSASGADLSGLERGDDEPVTVFKALALAAPAPAPAPAPKPVEKKEPVVFGTLSTKLGEVGTAPAPAALKVSSLGAKKASKPKLAARKLTGGGSGVRMESFEDVDKRSGIANQELQDRALAVKLHNADADIAGSSRLAAVYQDSESIYKPAPAPQRAQAPSPRGSGVPKAAPADGGYAQSKFPSAKGISSDQYFERGQQQTDAAKARLGSYAGSSAISSEMLHGGGERASSYEDFIPDELSMREIKKSVRGFFDSVQNM